MWEEALGHRFPGTPGLAGKDHPAAGAKFLQTLMKPKRRGNFDLLPWEKGLYCFGGDARSLCIVILFRSSAKEELDKEDKERCEKLDKGSKGRCCIWPWAHMLG